MIVSGHPRQIRDIIVLVTVIHLYIKVVKYQLSFSPIRSTSSYSNGLSGSVEELRRSLRRIPPARLAASTDAGYREFGKGVGEFFLSFFDAPICLTYPDLIAQFVSGEKLTLPVQALLLYYFANSDGIPLFEKWVSFGDLPDGRMYERAFQGYSGDKLSRLLGNQIEDVQAASLAAGGEPVEGGDAGFQFSALPRVPLRLIYWLGEDEFPPVCKILYDISAPSHLPIDVCAILGSMLVSRIIKAAGDVRNRAASQ
jgi:hypothetical protein